MRLIDADALIEQKLRLESDTFFFLLYDVDEFPTIDAEPVRHGHWILEREPNGKPYCFHCSVCDYDFHHIGIKSATDYCPLCGAKMDGD